MRDDSVSLATIQAARQRLKGVAHQTPLLESTWLNHASTHRVFLKSEHLQRVGAFKFRGAFNAAAQLTPDELPKGLITQSSGNHAQALALTARLLQTSAHIIMPSNAPTPKIDAVGEYGAKIHFCNPSVEDRERLLRSIESQTEAVYIPPYDHPSVISGQGTIGLEILDALPDLNAIITPVGGGGLLSGVATAVKCSAPHIKVFGAEPLGADDAARSLSTGKLIPQTSPQTIADGLLTSLGSHTWPLISRYVDDIITVSEDEIISAMRNTWERTKQLIEPSAAVAVAALLSDRFLRDDNDKKIAVVLSGGNVDLARLPWGT